MDDISILVILFIFFTWHILSNCVLITCICYLYFNYLCIYYYALLPFYRCTLYCMAFFCSCTMKLYWLYNSCLCYVLILSCFIFSCQSTCQICETYICVGNSLSIKGNQIDDMSKLGWLIRLLEQNTSWGALSPLCWFNNKEFRVLHIQSNTTIFYLLAQ